MDAVHALRGSTCTRGTPSPRPALPHPPPAQPQAFPPAHARSIQLIGAETHSKLAGRPVYTCLRWAAQVIGIEKHPELAEMSVANVRSATPHLLESGVIEVRMPVQCGQGLAPHVQSMPAAGTSPRLPDLLPQPTHAWAATALLRCTCCAAAARWQRAGGYTGERGAL